jgi:hypothetical protein
MNEIKSPYATISYNEPVISYTFHEDVEVGFPEVQELVAHAETLSGKKPYVVIQDMRVNMRVTPAGRKTMADKKDVPLKRGHAMLVHEHELKKATDFFNETHYPDCPFQVFTDKEKAIEWLLKLPV